MEPKCTSAKLPGRGPRQEAEEAEEARDQPTRTHVKRCQVSFAVCPRPFDPFDRLHASSETPNPPPYAPNPQH